MKEKLKSGFESVVAMGALIAATDKETMIKIQAIHLLELKKWRKI